MHFHRKSGAPESQVKKALNWVVVGGGPTGVELTAELCVLSLVLPPMHTPSYLQERDMNFFVSRSVSPNDTER